MARPEGSLNAAEKLDFVLSNEVLWDLGEAAPRREPGTPGAPRQYPEWVWVLFDAYISISLSARKATAELRTHWPSVRAAAEDRYPDRPEMWAPATPPQRHHWQYAKLRLRQPDTLRNLIREFETRSAQQAVEMGIADPCGGGSYSHPDELRTLTGDGKVVTPLYRAKRDTPIVNKDTGEILGRRKADPTAMLHVEGGGNQVYGNKFVMVTGRTPDWHGRMVLGLGHVATKTGEAQVAVECVERVRRSLPGAQALVYDGALRGKHVLALLRAGILPISPPTARRAATADTEREEKSSLIETRQVDGRQVALYALGSQIGIADFDAEGGQVFVPLRRLRIKPGRNADGTIHWHGQYQLPDDLGGAKIWIRADTTPTDTVNRSENFRLIPPDDPDYERLYPLRSDSEANNRQLEDTLWINRAHSNGADAQLLDLLGYALVYNSIAIGLARARNASLRDAAIAA